MSTAGIGARLAAAQMLHAVLFEKLLMSEAMVGKGNPLDRLAPQDRARAQSLANGVLRHLAALDAVLDQFLEKSPPLKVRNALRLATFEMLAEDIAPHAAVNAAVEIVGGSPKTTHLAGLTNAVARRVAAGCGPTHRRCSLALAWTSCWREEPLAPALAGAAAARAPGSRGLAAAGRA